MKKKILILGIICIIAYFVYEQFSLSQDTSKNVLVEVEKEVEATKEVEEVVIEEKPVLRLEEIEKLKDINGDTKGILTVSGTNIDYPVLQTNDNEYYLYRDIHKEKNKNGSIYLDFESILPENPNNLIFYGHNMKNSTMFSDVNKFKDLDFFNENSKITFYLPTETREYEVLGGFIMDLTDEENFFQYNDYINSSEVMNSIDYGNEVKKRAVHYRDLPIAEDSNFVTLSTCTYESDDARFVLVGIEKP